MLAVLVIPLVSITYTLAVPNHNANAGISPTDDQGQTQTLSPTHNADTARSENSRAEALWDTNNEK
jgi:hypothetical protein